jgi:hypothetical protein
LLNAEPAPSLRNVDVDRGLFFAIEDGSFLAKASFHAPNSLRLSRCKLANKRTKRCFAPPQPSVRTDSCAERECRGFDCVSPAFFRVIEMAGFRSAPFSDPTVEMAHCFGI